LDELAFGEDVRIKKRLLHFEGLRKIILRQIHDIARFTRLETAVCEKNQRTTYFAKKALITVFIDCAERSPTFRLHPLDRIGEKTGRSWVQVMTEAENGRQAWHSFLGRPFRGLKRERYEPCFLSQIDDAYLRKAALKSLAAAGENQAELYDFSFSRKNISARLPQKGDLGVLVCVDEEIEELGRRNAAPAQFVRIFKERGAHMALILAGDIEVQRLKAILRRFPLQDRDVVILLDMERTPDPLGIKRQIILKILLNAHSTGIMARLGRIVGNTMTNVQPGNLKLIGRATFLIKSHVNDAVSRMGWRQRYGRTAPITYAEANAVLYAALDFSETQGSQISEVELSIIGILESLRKQAGIRWNEALSIAHAIGLENYLESLNPSSRR